MSEEAESQSLEGPAWTDDEIEEEVIDPSQPSEPTAEPPAEAESAPLRFTQHYPLPEGTPPHPEYTGIDKRQFNKGPKKDGPTQKEQLAEVNTLADALIPADTTDEIIPPLEDDAEVKKFLKKNRTALMGELMKIAKSAKATETVRLKAIERLLDMDMGKPAIAAQDDGGDEIGSVIIGEL